MIGVTGATGELGRQVIESLLARGSAPGRIAALARSPTKIDARGLEARRCDYGDPEGMRAAFRGIETLVFIPSKSPVVPRVQEYAAALAAAKEAGVARLVFASLTTARPESVSLIAPFFLFAESATRLSGLEWVILRNSLYLDPLAEWAPELVRMGRLPYPVAEGRTTYVSRRDIARATAAAALDPTLVGRVFELTGPAAVTMPELAGALSEATGRPIRFETISEAEFLELCAVDPETSPFVAQVLVTLYRAVERGEFATVSDDIERLTGEPPESVAAFLKRSLQSA